MNLNKVVLLEKIGSNTELKSALFCGKSCDVISQALSVSSCSRARPCLCFFGKKGHHSPLLLFISSFASVAGERGQGVAAQQNSSDKRYEYDSFDRSISGGAVAKEEHVYNLFSRCWSDDGV
jgi:hypothetical protein